MRSTYMMHKQVECIYSKTHTFKSNEYILKHTVQVFCLNVIHAKVSTPMYVYLRQGAQSGEDCVRQRG